MDVFDAPGVRGRRTSVPTTGAKRKPDEDESGGLEPEPQPGT